MEYDKSTSQKFARRAKIMVGIMVIIAVISAMRGGEQPLGIVGEYELRSGTESMTGYIDGQDFVGKQVEYSQVDGLPMVEGDILLQLQPDTAGVGVKGRNPRDLRWPNGVVAYQIDPQLRNQQRVIDAIAHWEARTEIRFVARDASNSAQYPNYILFRPGGGCSSYVGMIGGMQPIILADGCGLGATIHEIGHAVGLWHEQSRADRDNYITVHFENIIRGTEFNFFQHIADGQDIGPYDFASIMHYPRWAFSKNGKDTIVPKGNQEIGQRNRLSDGDIQAVRQMYEGIIQR